MPVENTRKFDLAIVGGGPAGATFARCLAKDRPDLKIVLVDDHRPERQKPCGGLLSTDGQKKLAEQDLTLPKSVLADPQIFGVRVVDLEQNLDNTYPRNYLNMDRYQFDIWLLSLVPDWVLHLKQRCQRVEKHGEDFVLTLDSKDQIMARYLIGADGAGSMVRRTFFPHAKTNNYISIQQWFHLADVNRAGYYCVFDQETSDSFSWFFNKNNYIVFGGAFPKENSRKRFDEQKEKFAQRMGYNLTNPIRTEACQVVFSRKNKEIFLGDESVFLLGEAAGLISPSSFDGISYGLDSGEKLAKVFVELLKEVNTHTDKSLMRKYHQYAKKLVFKVKWRMIKRNILCQPYLRKMIMKSRIQSIK